jgi:hypothetical protein
MSEEKSTESTESNEAPEAGAKPDDQLGAGGKKALDSERKARREAERQAREYQEKVEALERDKLIGEVATEKKLTPAQATRLQGSTKEELEQDADDLLEAFGGSKPTTTSRPTERLHSGTTGDDEPAEDFGKMADQIVGPGI